MLRVVGAGFVRDGETIVAPFSLDLAPGARADITLQDRFATSVAARMCAAIVKPSVGAVFIDAFETRLQPPAAKRRTGFVDSGGFVGSLRTFDCEVAFRAEVWGITREAARMRSQAVLARLGDGPHGRAIALALIPEVTLLVLDQPTADLDDVAALVPAASILRAIAHP